MTVSGKQSIEETANYGQIGFFVPIILRMNLWTFTVLQPVSQNVG